jgi:hypothetical protein
MDWTGLRWEISMGTRRFSLDWIGALGLGWGSLLEYVVFDTILLTDLLIRVRLFDDIFIDLSFDRHGKERSDLCRHTWNYVYQ